MAYCRGGDWYIYRSCPEVLCVHHEASYVEVSIETCLASQESAVRIILDACGVADSSEVEWAVEAFVDGYKAGGAR